MEAPTETSKQQDERKFTRHKRYDELLNWLTVIGSNSNLANCLLGWAWGPVLFLGENAGNNNASSSKHAH